MYHLTEDELRQAGVSCGDAYVEEKLVAVLQRVNAHLASSGFELIIKDGYRSKELYLLVQQKRYAQFGQEATDKILNLERMAHVTGLTVDVGLVDVKSQKEIEMRDKEDGIEGMFVGFYAQKSDAKSRRYQQLQVLLIEVMTDEGFVLGSKKEFWHFEYDG